MECHVGQLQKHREGKKLEQLRSGIGGACEKCVAGGTIRQRPDQVPKGLVKGRAARFSK